jgi:hypothetical protein
LPVVGHPQRTIEEWAQHRNAAQDGLKWANGCKTQLERWKDARQRAHRQFPPDWPVWAQMFVEGDLLAVAAGHLVDALLDTPHEDILLLLPTPDLTDPTLPGAGHTGAEFFRYIRNAHEHNDDRGWFFRDYGFSHGPHVGDIDGTNGSIGGIRQPAFGIAIDAILAELKLRDRHALGHMESARP